MNGPIAQLVALACHGNAFLRDPSRPAMFFPGNSTCRFCDRVAFVETKKPLFAGKQREVPIAPTPDAWIVQLAQSGARGLRVMHHSTHHPLFADRMTAGLVGGGGRWMLAVRRDRSTQYWEAGWQVWNREAPEQRIWRVAYRPIATRDGPPPSDTPFADVREALRAALVRIHAFAAAQSAQPFADCFARALESLANGGARHGYHQDLFADAALSDEARSLLDAAQSAWVFGGMGSWNDLGFDGDAGKEYEAASAQLFAVLCEAICAAANVSDTAPNVPAPAA